MNRNKDASFHILPPGAFRMVLAMAVVISHVTRADIGRIAVLLFFFLSGFWVSKIYKGEFGRTDWRRFYASRWLRIAPLYFIVLTAYAFLRGDVIHPSSLTIFGLYTAKRDPLGVAWSLDIELQFYLLLPLFFVVAHRLSMTARVLLTAALTAAGWWVHSRFGLGTVFMYLPTFALGALTEQTGWAPGPKAAAASLVGFGAVTVAFALIPYTSTFLDKTVPDPFDRDLFSMVWMLPILPYVAQSLAHKSSRLDRDVGNWSYPLYLVHWPLIALFVGWGLSKWLAVPFALAIALALFYGPDQIFERHRRLVVNGAKALAARPRTSAPRQAIRPAANAGFESDPATLP
jgi:peptidoglycan/LPS O-acetylase OafA/YrhL